MRARRAAGTSHETKDLAGLHRLAFRYRETGKMRVARADAVSMVYVNHHAVARIAVRKLHHTVGGGLHRQSEIRGDVDARVERAFSIERIHAVAKRSRDRTFYRPQRRNHHPTPMLVE